MTSQKYAFVTLLTLFLICAPSVSAQSDRGAITGRVTDPAGAVVPQAKVTATNVETNETRETVTGDEGNFTIPQIPAAMYKLTVEATGFKTATLDNIKVAVSITRTTDIQLEVGGVGESVTVSDEGAPVLQTDTPVQQLNVSERQVRELPLLVAAESGGRSPLSFIFLDSSIVSNDTPGGTGTTSGSTGTNATNFRINGGQGLGADILIDGAQTRRGENGTFFSEVAPGPNAFQEFTVSTSSYSAEFGNSTGGVVNFTIKTGGNDFHGEAYLFHINDALNANIDRNRILNANNAACRLQNIGCIDKPLDRQFDYGFSVGGPVYLPRFGEGGEMLWSGKNKTFFFFNYGGYRTFQSESVELTVPTVRMRNGDFGELLTDPYVLQFFGPGGVQIFDPSQSGATRTAIPGNRLDQYLGGARISSIGRNFVNLFPLPNQTGPNGSTVFHNFRANTTATSRTDYYVSKITHNLTDRQSLNFSYTFRKLPSVKGGFPRFPAPFVAQGVWDQLFKSYYARLQHDWTVTGTFINHFNAGFSRSDVSNRNFSSGVAQASDLGLSPTATQDRGLPLIGFPGYGDDPVTATDPRAYQPGGSTFFDNRVRDNSVHLSDVATNIRGRHTMKFGGELRLQQLNNAAHFDIGGNFNFRHNQTARGIFNANGDLIGDVGGWPIASLITGRPEFSFNSNQTIDPGHRFLSYAAFFQDDFKITSRLTVNLGLRYDFGRPREEARGRFRGFDPNVPNPAAGGRLGAIIGATGQGGIKADNFGLVEPDRTNFGPRFGFAYSLNEKTVLRGGYGIYYAPIIYNDFGNAGALGYSPGALNINGGVDAGITLENYPNIPAADPNSQVVGDLNRTDLDYFTKDFKTGRTVQYTLDIQRQLPWNLALQVGYVGSKGTRLRSNFNQINALPLAALKLGLPLLSKRLADVNASDRAYAASVGFPLPASPDAVYPGFNNQFGDFAGSVGQALRPFPQYGNIINRLESEGQSFYNAGKVDLSRRFAQGFQAGLSYTFAKLITDAAEDVFGNSPLNGVVQNPHDRESLRTISASIPPHSLVFNYIIEAPFGKGRRFLNRGGLVDRLIGGFQVTAIHRYRSGPALLPFIAGGQRDFLQRVGFLGNLRPNVTGQSFFTENAAGGVNYRYLNPAAFSRPVDYRNAPAFPIGSPEYAAFYADPLRFFGNSSPTYSTLRAKPFFTEDLSVMKKTRVTETTYFEIRIEIFNLLNRGRYGLPNLNLDSGNFGIVARNADIFQPRRIQVGGRFVF